MVPVILAILKNTLNSVLSQGFDNSLGTGGMCSERILFHDRVKVPLCFRKHSFIPLE